MNLKFEFNVPSSKCRSLVRIFTYKLPLLQMQPLFFVVRFYWKEMLIGRMGQMEKPKAAYDGSRSGGI